MLKKYLAASIGLLMSTAALPAQAQQIFDFSFTAPLTNGDTASGSGKLFTEDADAEGRYYFLAATGSFLGYQDEANARPITAAFGIQGFFDLVPGFLFKDGSGNFVTDSVLFADWESFNFIGFQKRADGLYDGFFSEVGVSGATLTFSQATAAVPEPAAWGMMVLGMGAIGATIRRRQKVRVTYA